MRVGSCKRSASEQLPGLKAFQAHVDRFRNTKEGRRLTCWTQELALYPPTIPQHIRQAAGPDYKCYDFADFAAMLGVEAPQDGQIPLGGV